MVTSYIAIGSNVGERRSFCRDAVAMLGESPDVNLLAVSSLYETSPVGGPPQRSFVNAVAKIETSLAPNDLLALCKAIEVRLGREPGEMRWGPRVVDLDVLLYDDVKVNDPDLRDPSPTDDHAFVRPGAAAGDRSRGRGPLGDALQGLRR